MGSKPTSPLVFPLQHDGSVGGLEYPPPQHHDMRKWGGTEAAQAGHGVAVGYQGTGFQGVWLTAHLGDIIQVT